MSVPSPIGTVSPATKFEDCLRRCNPCGIGVSNTAGPNNVTFIYADPLANIPAESRDGAIDALGQAFNIRNRESKWRRFGFSTSEDAVTWVVFTYLLRSKQLIPALRDTGLNVGKALNVNPTLLLWGVPISASSRGEAIRAHLTSLCANLHENTNSFSEPDVIIDLGDAGIAFIEVKYLSGNDCKPADYHSWSRYSSAPWTHWRFDEVKASGCYELARNWCLLKGLAAGRHATLVSLGRASLFRGPEDARLNHFVNALDIDESSEFKRIKWPDFIGDAVAKAPKWFSDYCRVRGLIE